MYLVQETGHGAQCSAKGDKCSRDKQSRKRLLKAVKANKSQLVEMSNESSGKAWNNSNFQLFSVPTDTLFSCRCSVELSCRNPGIAKNISVLTSP